MASPPPSYHEELAEGETTIVPADRTPVPASEEQKKPVRLPPPIPIPPPLQEGASNPVPTPLPYTTPLQTPFVTAPNTPMFFAPGQNFPCGVPFAQLAAQQQQQQQMLMMMMQQHQPTLYHQPAISMQPMYSAQRPAPPQPQNPGINVVVNANANSDAAGGGGLTAPDGTKLRICPSCKKGILVREQHRKRAKLIKTLACVTSCSLFCLPCVLLCRNYADQCPACHEVFGKAGGKKAKKPKYA